MFQVSDPAQAPATTQPTWQPGISSQISSSEPGFLDSRALQPSAPPAEAINEVNEVPPSYYDLADSCERPIPKPAETEAPPSYQSLFPSGQPGTNSTPV